MLLCTNSPQTHFEHLKKKIKRAYISQIARVTTGSSNSSRSLRLPLQTGLRAADVWTGLPRHTHPLIINTTFNLRASLPGNTEYPFTGHTTGGVIKITRTSSLRHSPRCPTPPPCSEAVRLFVSSAITTMRQAAWQRCGMKRRSGGGSIARTTSTETPRKLSPCRVGGNFGNSCTFSRRE